MKISLISLAALSLSLGGLAAAPALAADGTTRNQAALAVAGRTTPAMKACVKAAKTNVRARCAVNSNANQFQDERASSGGGIYLAAAIAAGVAALTVIAVTESDDGDDVPTPAPTPTPTPVSS